MLSWAGLPLSFGLGLARKDPLIVVGALRRNTSLAMQMEAEKLRTGD